MFNPKINSRTYNAYLGTVGISAEEEKMIKLAIKNSLVEAKNSATKLSPTE